MAFQNPARHQKVSPAATRELKVGATIDPSPRYTQKRRPRGTLSKGRRKVHHTAVKLLRLASFLIPLAQLQLSFKLVLRNEHGGGVLPPSDTLGEGDRLKRSFDAALATTTSILYKHSADLNYWLAQPAPVVYIYDNIAAEYSDVARVSDCVDRAFGVTRDSSLASLPPWRNCKWQPEICEDAHAPYTDRQAKFGSYKNNHNQDVAYLRRFKETYPYTTTDPHTADVFLVPFPMKSHCLCHVNLSPTRSRRCAADFEQIQRNVVDKLAHQEHAFRHLFLWGSDQWADDRLTQITKVGLTLTLGPVFSRDPTSGLVAVPYINPSPAVQPRVIAERRKEWWTKERPFALGAAFGVTGALNIREEFLSRAEDYVGTLLGGKPHSIHRLGKKRGAVANKTTVDFVQLYRQSTFCLILKGDCCHQKRFFDAVMNGCIPILPRYFNADKNVTYFAKGGCDAASTYPFSEGNIVPGDIGTDVTNIILTFDGDCGFSCMREPMERLLTNKPALREHQLRLRDYAVLSSFGLSKESYAHPDAFVATVVALRHKIWHRMGKVRDAKTSD